MTNQESKNYNRQHAMKYFTVLISVFVFAFIIVPSAFAAVIYSQTVHNGIIAGRIPPGQTEHYALGQIVGTVNFIKVRAQNTIGASNTIEVALLCYNDSGYTSLNNGCSWNETGGRDGTVGRFVASSNSDVEFTVTPSTPFVLESGKYYRLGFDCISGCTAGVTETKVIGDTSTSEPYYVLDGVSGPTTELEVDGPFPLGTVPESVNFTMSWNNLDFDPYYLYFFRDANEYEAETVVQYYPMGGVTGSGTWSFSIPYTVADTYIPYAVLGSSTCNTVTATGSITGSGCVLSDAVGSGITLISLNDLYVSYDNQFIINKTNDVRVGEVLGYTYQVDPQMCVDNGSTVSGRRLFKGYPGPLSYKDTGTILSSNSGTGTIVFTETVQPYSDFYYPSVRVYCLNGTSFDVYLNGEMRPGFHVGVSVYTETELRSRDRSTMTYLAGGEDEDLGDADTYSFFAEKHVYQPYEPINIKYKFYPPSWFTVDSVRIYPDKDLIDYFYTLEDSLDIEEGKTHYYTYSYNENGEYNPRVELVSSTGALIGFYLGGQQTISAYEPIVVTGLPWASSILKTDAGIFGLGVDSVKLTLCDASDCPWYLSTIDTVLNPFIKAVIWVASKFYSIIEQLPVFNFVHQIINPEEGLSYQLPTQVFGINLDWGLSYSTYTIHKADSDAIGAIVLAAIFKILIGLYVFKHVMSHIF